MKVTSIISSLVLLFSFHASSFASNVLVGQGDLSRWSVVSNEAFCQMFAPGRSYWKKIRRGYKCAIRSDWNCSGTCCYIDADTNIHLALTLASGQEVNLTADRNHQSYIIIEPGEWVSNKTIERCEPFFIKGNRQEWQELLVAVNTGQIFIRGEECYRKELSMTVTANWAIDWRVEETPAVCQEQDR